MLILMLALFYHKTCSIYEFLHHDTYYDLEISHTILYDAFIILYNLEIRMYQIFHILCHMAKWTTRISLRCRDIHSVFPYKSCESLEN